MIIEMDKLKKVELEIFKTFCTICNDYKLTYYIVGGTLLGAIRHKGFIPWDDDIDVAMPRKDYEKFMSIANDVLPSYYFAQNYHTDPNYLLCFGKIRDSRTTFIESGVKSQKINHGVYIDIFPLDFYPTTLVKKKIMKGLDLLYRARISCAFDSVPSKKMKLLQIFSKCFCTSTHSAVYKRDQLMKSIHSSSLLANICGAWGDKEIMPKSWFGEGLQVLFEGLYVNAPAQYHEYLTQVYGDYMTPPPKDKQVSHHYTEIIDLDNSYTIYYK